MELEGGGNSTAFLLTYKISKNTGPLNPGQKSIKVNKNDTVRYITYNFVFTFYRTFGTSLHRY